MIKTVIILFITCSISCSKRSNSSAIIPPANNPTGEMLKKYLALGDSYTIGQSVPSIDRFPMQTVSMLLSQGIRTSEPEYIAQTGWTTGNLQSAIAAKNLSPVYDVVSLLIGVNDQYQQVDTAIYAIRFTQLLEKSIELAKGARSRVFVLSIPDYSVTPFVPVQSKSRVRMEIDWFNQINKRITASYGISYIDITPSSREAETNPALIAYDNLHPSGAEYRKWAEMLAPKIKAVLQ